MCRCAVLNGAFLGVVVYSLFYIGLEQFAGVTWCLSTGIPCWLTATAFSQHVPHAWAYAIGVHVLSWWAQIHLGHMMLEHRKPALLDSFFQAMTPLHAMPCHASCITCPLPAMLHYTVCKQLYAKFCLLSTLGGLARLAVWSKWVGQTLCAVLCILPRSSWVYQFPMDVSVINRACVLCRALLWQISLCGWSFCSFAGTGRIFKPS